MTLAAWRVASDDAKKQVVLEQHRHRVARCSLQPEILQFRNQTCLDANILASASIAWPRLTSRRADMQQKEIETRKHSQSVSK